MEKFRDNSFDKIGVVDEIIWHRRADNMKKVPHPLFGNVDVCPYPPSHYPDLKAEADRISYAKIEPSKVGIK